MFAINLDVGDIVLKHSGDINLWEGSLGENNEETSLSASTITNDDELPTYFGHIVE